MNERIDLSDTKLVTMRIENKLKEYYSNVIKIELDDYISANFRSGVAIYADCYGTYTQPVLMYADGKIYVEA